MSRFAVDSAEVLLKQFEVIGSGEGGGKRLGILSAKLLLMNYQRYIVGKVVIAQKEFRVLCFCKHIAILPHIE